MYHQPDRNKYELPIQDGTDPRDELRQTETGPEDLALIAIEQLAEHSIGEIDGVSHEFPLGFVAGFGLIGP